MRPNKFIRIRQMPYNSNGKVDRKLLKTNYLEENQLEHYSRKNYIKSNYYNDYNNIYKHYTEEN